MSKAISIRRGLNIRLKGEAEKVLVTVPVKGTYAIKPTDFNSLTPKVVVKEGDNVKAGSVLFYDKYNERIKFVSPVSGKVTGVIRGEKRKLLEVRVEASENQDFETHKAVDPKTLSREQVLDAMLNGGIWPFIRQRPFSSVANPQDNPKSIFISAFDTSPLAPDYDFIVHGHGEEFQIGLDAVAKLTSGKVHLNVNGTAGQSKVFSNSKGVQINTINGPHPAGNVGVQIHHIDPINKGDVIWYLNPQDVLTIGRFFKTGKFDASRIFAVTGSEVKHPKYVKTVIGGNVGHIIENNINGDNVRVISGNVLTGNAIGKDGNLGFYDSQVTVIPEGDHPQFFMTEGWAGPGFGKFSLSRTFPTFLMPGKKYDLNTNMNGEERAFVMTEQYEKVFPFDIYPVYLIKAIITNDLEGMENLGIYEVDPEDFALCEFVCTSKINSQEIVRSGLDLVRKECM
ncbi:MAG: Na(+)-translocating NADH-quinone reductase subunit A [Bacteroidota bacterium]